MKFKYKNANSPDKTRNNTIMKSKTERETKLRTFNGKGFIEGVRFYTVNDTIVQTEVYFKRV